LWQAITASAAPSTGDSVDSKPRQQQQPLPPTKKSKPLVTTAAPQDAAQAEAGCGPAVPPSRDVQALTVNQLKAELKQRSLPSSGNKSDLAARLQAHMALPPEAQQQQAAAARGAAERKNGCRSEKSYDLPLRTRLIRVYPTPEQKAAFRTWFAGKRFIYNQAVTYMNEHPCATIQDLREKFMPKPAPREEEGEAVVADTAAAAAVPRKACKNTAWLERMPYDIRDQAFHDIIKARCASSARRSP
jgi:hypothetical protein